MFDVGVLDEGGEEDAGKAFFGFALVFVPVLLIIRALFIFRIVFILIFLFLLFLIQENIQKLLPSKLENMSFVSDSLQLIFNYFLTISISPKSLPTFVLATPLHPSLLIYSPVIILGNQLLFFGLISLSYRLLSQRCNF